MGGANLTGAWGQQAKTFQAELIPERGHPIPMPTGQENPMKTIFRTLKVVLALTIVAACLIPLASCGGVSDAQSTADPSGEPIVGFWYFKFVAQGNTAESSGLPADQVPPDGAVLDSGYAQWHSDGTEISNSSRQPVTQSFCLGVWEKAGGLQYQLNHFAISWVFSGTETYLGPTNIGQNITLSSDHNSFTGTVAITQYDASGNQLVSLKGNVQGQRISVTTPVQNVLPVPPMP
jgi:hypothetical protein